MSKESKQAITIEETINHLVQKGNVALSKMETLNQEQVDTIVYEMSLAAIDQHMPLAKLAVEETGRGVYEDKAIKTCSLQKVFGIILNIIKQLALLMKINKLVLFKSLLQSVFYVVLHRRQTLLQQLFLKQ